jgi:hypothetical protein
MTNTNQHANQPQTLIESALTAHEKKIAAVLYVLSLRK